MKATKSYIAAASLRNITVQYGKRVVLKDLELDIIQGAITCIIGLSGAGKSSILRLINGLRQPTRGRVMVDGLDLSTLQDAALIKLRQSIGFSFQFAALFDSMTVFDNVALPLRETTSLGKNEIAQRVNEMLHYVGLDRFADAFPAELSGGMVKRAGFARAVVTRPHLVLYDEPTTGLDPIMTRALTDTIRRLQQRDRSTCVVVSHDLVSINHMADYIAMLFEGKILAYGTPSEIAASDDARVRQFLEGRTDGPIQL